MSDEKKLILDETVLEKISAINPECGYYAFCMSYRDKKDWDYIMSIFNTLGLSYGDSKPPEYEDVEFGGSLMIYFSKDDRIGIIKNTLVVSYISRPDLWSWDISFPDLFTLLSGDFSVIVLPESKLLLNKSGAFYCIADSPGIMVNRKIPWDSIVNTWEFKGKTACRYDKKIYKRLQEKFPDFAKDKSTGRVLVTDFENKKFLVTDDPLPSIVYHPIEEVEELLACDIPVVCKLHKLDLVFIGEKGFMCFHDTDAGSPIAVPDMNAIRQYILEYKRQYID